MNIKIGTASWTDPTLIACKRFYPPGCTSAEARLRHYASQFSLVEVDSIYYSMPSASNSAQSFGIRVGLRTRAPHRRWRWNGIEA